MRAVVYTEYGVPEVLQIQEVEKPTPKNNEVLIRVHATSVTAACCMVRKGEPRWGRVILGLTKPSRRIIGTELAGEIVTVGSAVTRFKPGDQVYGFTGFSLGAYAEYTCMKETASLAVMPAGLSYEEAAAAVDGATTALFFLRDKAKIQTGQKVLINGASGSIGTYAVQLAKYFGAHVTGVCSGKNTELVTSLGADRVIDYTKEDFTRTGDTYDIIFDTVGKSSFAQSQRALTPNGCYVPTVGLIINNLQMLRTSITGGKRVIMGMSVEKSAHLVFIKNLIESGQLKIIIDRCYPLEQIAEAHRYVESGHKQGNVIITVA